MEAYVVGIGMIPCLEQWEKDLQAVKLPFTYEQGKKKCLIRLGVDRIQLYKIRFPEDQLEVVSQMLGISNYIPERFPKIKKFISMLRKIMKMDELKIPNKVIEHMQPDQINKAVAIIPIGTKKDAFAKEGFEHI